MRELQQAPVNHSSALLSTKLALPRASLSLVPREPLLARLDAGIEHKLTLLSAPAGFGKTSEAQAPTSATKSKSQKKWEKVRMSQISEDFEGKHLQYLQQMLDPVTKRRFERLGVQKGWRYLEVGAGEGSIAHWLAKRVGLQGTVVATDIDTRLLGKQHESNLEVRRHDILADEADELAISRNTAHCCRSFD